MIGLALSMGASSLLLPRQDDSAAAAEPMSTEPTAEVVPLTSQAAALPTGTTGDSPAQPAMATTSMVSHVVREGQTLWQLSRRYRVPVRAIADANGISADTILRVGQVIKIPATGSSTTISAVPAEPTALASGSATSAPHLAQVTSPAPIVTDNLLAERDESLSRLRQQRDRLRDSLAGLGAEEYDLEEPSKAQAESMLLDPGATTGAKPDEASVLNQDASSAIEAGISAGTYQVKPGDTLAEIALRHEVPQQDLALANRLDDPNFLQVDQELMIPSTNAVEELAGLADAGEPAGNSEVVHRVGPGETIDEIANLHGITEGSLIAANHLSNPDFILVGQLLTIPGDLAERPNSDEAVAVLPDTAPTPLSNLGTQAGALAAVPPVNQPSAVAVLPTVPLDTQMPSPDTASVTLPGIGSSDAVFSTEFVEPLSAPAASEDVAVAPATTPAITNSLTLPGSSSTTTERDPFVDNLVAEIMVLRDRYRAEAELAEGSSELAEMPEVEAPEVVAVAPSETSAALLELAAPIRMNPQFSPAPEERLETDVDISEGTGGAEVEVAVPADGNSETDESRLLAAAPLGAENYAPLLESLTGQIVSPDLPPLPSAEAYLPDGSQNFSGYIWPARGVLTSGYGWRWGRMHRGIDIGAPTGTPVYAAAAGVVEFSGWNSGGYGNMVEIRHADGSMTRYAHHSRNLVRVGQRVRQGEQIAEIGSTGYSTGPHLHFEVHLPNQGTVNPIAYLPGQ
jgi:murein DD-endopeptidase MepM/ murein hydrolase activator NlpD